MMIQPKIKLKIIKKMSLTFKKGKEQQKKNQILEIINALYVIKAIYLILLYILIANKSTIQIIILEEEGAAQKKNLQN